jgi:uncharacterized protein YgbK (DUF1537 family)
MIGVIADDLSGAAEIGGIGLRHGLSAEIVVRGEPTGSADLVCVDTDSRSRTSEEAAQRVADATRLLQRAGAEWIFKKVDSVLRGHVTVEVQAMMSALEVSRALLISANPSRGRIVRNGRYYVEGKPIHETEFARDPEHPRTSAKIRELLEPSMGCPLEVVKPRGRLPASGIVVGEATKADDLDGWAEKRMSRTAFAGAAEFFTALLKAKGYSPTENAADDGGFTPNVRELFVCGTTSKSAKNFLRAARARKTPIFSLPSELVWGAEFTDMARDAVARRALAGFEQSSRVILNVGLPSMRGPEAARMLTTHLVQLAQVVMREADVTHIFAEGGATGAALVQRSGWECLNVLRELAPGVARLAVVGNRSIVLTIKPGSYVWPSEIRRGAGLACEAAA